MNRISRADNSGSIYCLKHYFKPQFYNFLFSYIPVKLTHFTFSASGFMHAKNIDYYTYRHMYRQVQINAHPIPYVWQKTTTAHDNFPEMIHKLIFPQARNFGSCGISFSLSSYKETGASGILVASTRVSVRRSGSAGISLYAGLLYGCLVSVSLADGSCGLNWKQPVISARGWRREDDL